MKNVLENIFEYVGAIHIHSTHSDGSKTIPEIVEIGKQAELDFLMFSDHMTLKPLEEGKEGWYERLLVLIGYEIQDMQNKNHYLAFNLKEVLPFHKRAQEYVKKVGEAGGLGIIAHPDEVRNQLPGYPPYPWTAWDADGFNGIEIWNQMSEWMEKLTRLNRIKMVFFPRRSLKGPTKKILEIWDNYSHSRKILGIGGVDAHGYPYRFGPLRLTIFPYLVQFKSIRTHILCDTPLSTDFREAKKQVLKSLRECQAFVSNFRWGDAKGFRFWAENEKDSVTIGGEIKIVKQVVFKASFPRTCWIRLIGNGQVLQETEDKRVEFTTSKKGSYRVEGIVNGKGWIYSNHIRVL